MYRVEYPIDMSNNLHQPVLLKEVVKLLDPRPGQDFLDLTAGYGGHSAEVEVLIGDSGTLTLVDRDINAIQVLAERFKNPNVELINSDFLSASKELLESGKRFDGILADIGVSSPHLDNPDRGFSFMNDGPLDMRMDSRSQKTAADIVNDYSEEALADVLFQYGEITSSRKLASLVVQSRPITSTSELASVIPGGYKLHLKLCAQVFQALRIEVNDELTQLEKALPIWHQLLKPGGRLAVITFHSLEDRIVKQYFREHSMSGYESSLRSLTKRPATASQDELVFNPRSRSAKLRVAQRK